MKTQRNWNNADGDGGVFAVVGLLLGFVAGSIATLLMCAIGLLFAVTIFGPTMYVVMRGGFGMNLFRRSAMVIVICGLVMAATPIVAADSTIEEPVLISVSDPISTFLPQVENVVDVTCEVGEDGRVRRVLKNTATVLLKPHFDQAARQSKYRPARQNGRPIRGIVTLQFSYRVEKLGVRIVDQPETRPQ